MRSIRCDGLFCITIMKIYKVEWIERGAGGYVPPDPVSGGDYYTDRYGFEIVTAPTAKAAAQAVKTCRPSATVKRPKVVHSLQNAVGQPTP